MVSRSMRMQKRKHRTGKTAYHAGQWTKEENAAEPMTGLDPDAMDKGSLVAMDGNLTR